MIKAYYMIRKDLQLTPKELAVQIGHGTQYLVLNAKDQIVNRWIYNSDSQKVICDIEDLTQLNRLTALLASYNVDYRPIIDFNLTEDTQYVLTGIALFVNSEELAKEVLEEIQLYEEKEENENQLHFEYQ